MASRRLDRRQGFLISATVHLMILTLLAKTAEKTAEPKVTPSPSPAVSEPRRHVMLVSPRLAERLLRRQPAPPPPPPPQVGRDRVSVGPPSTERAKRLELRRDEELTSQPAGPGGLPKAGPPSPPPPMTAEARPSPTAPAVPEEPGTFGEGLTTQPRGTTPPRTGVPNERSIGRSLRDLDRRLGQMGTGAREGGVGRQMGPLFFDPEGADFTSWTNTFGREVYRNWIVPQSVLFGFQGGHVDIEFFVERDGRVTDIRIVKSSGTGALDRAAVNALTGARLDPLPADFRPQRLAVQVTFYYNEASQS